MEIARIESVATDGRRRTIRRGRPVRRPNSQGSHYFMVYFIVWSWLLVVRCRQITNYLTGQSRQGSNYLTGLSRQGSNYLTGLSRQIAFPLIKFKLIHSLNVFFSNLISLVHQIGPILWDSFEFFASLCNSQRELDNFKFNVFYAS